MKYDLVFPVAPKDYNKVVYSKQIAEFHLNPAPDNVYIVSKHDLNIPDTIWINEDKCLPITVNDISKLVERPPWIFQQMIKLCQNFTKNENYLCMDSDVFLKKDIDVFNGYRTLFYNNSREQHHERYFNFMKDAYNLDKVVEHTFIADFMTYNKGICREINDTVFSLLEKINKFLPETNKYLLAEQELYGNYCMKNYPDLFEIVPLKTFMYGRYDSYTEDEIVHIYNNHNDDCQLITMHSWT